MIKSLRYFFLLLLPLILLLGTKTSLLTTLSKNMRVVDNRYGNTMFQNELRYWYYSRAINTAIDSFGLGAGAGSSDTVIEGGSYHHHFFQMLANFGIFGLMGHLWLLLVISRDLWRLCRVRGKTYISTGLLASCVVFHIIAAGPSGLIGMCPYWLWLGLLLGFLNCRKFELFRSAALGHNPKISEYV